MDTVDTEVVDARAMADALFTQLQQQYGSVLDSSALIKELGYRSAASFQRALARGTVPIPVFKIQHRRGSFALALDVATWLSNQRAHAVSSKPLRFA